MLTRRRDGKTLVIEHTMTQPFQGEIEDYRKFFAPAFLQIEEDKSLVVPNRWIQVFIPARTLEGHRKPAARIAIVGAVRDWILDNRLKLPEGQSENSCRVAGVVGTPDFEITLTTKVTAMPQGGVAQPADKHVLILERQHMNLVPNISWMRLKLSGVRFRAYLRWMRFGYWRPSAINRVAIFNLTFCGKAGISRA